MKSIKYSLGVVIGITPLLAISERYKEKLTGERTA